MTLRNTPVEQLFAVICVMHMSTLPIPALQMSQACAFEELLVQDLKSNFRVERSKTISNGIGEKKEIGNKCKRKHKKKKKKVNLFAAETVCRNTYADVLTTQSATTSCIQAHISFASDDRSKRTLHEFITTEDTCSMVNCIVKSAVDSSWVVRPSDTVVKGVGGKLVHSAGKVTVPNHSFVYCGDKHELECDIVGNEK